VRVGGQHCRPLYKAVVSSSRVCVCGCTGIVQSREDSRWSLFFNEVAHNLVVKILDRIPLNLFSNIFFLLGLQCQLDEDLLQLFVDIVDAKLFEGVVLDVMSMMIVTAER